MQDNMQDQSSRIRDNRIRRSVGYALVRAFRRLNRVSSRAVAQFGISAEQAHIVTVLLFEGPCKIGELQRILALSSATLTGAIDRMEKAGLVRRRPDALDRRVFVVEPSKIEARRRREIIATLEEVEERSLALLSARERRELWRLLEKVAAGDPSPPDRRAGSRVKDEGETGAASASAPPATRSRLRRSFEVR